MNSPQDSKESDSRQADVRPEPHDEADFTDMLGELRVMLPTAQLLSAFLTTVPFTSGFGAIVTSEKHVFLATFLLSIASLILLSGPAVQHRLMRPLQNRVAFKQRATRQIVIGSCTLGLALVLVTELILSEVLGHLLGIIAGALVALLIVLVWWVLPKIWRRNGVL